MKKNPGLCTLEAAENLVFCDICNPLYIFSRWNLHLSLRDNEYYLSVQTLWNLKLRSGLDALHTELGKITCLEHLKVLSTLFSSILLNHLSCCIVLLLICFWCPLYTCESIWWESHAARGIQSASYLQVLLRKAHVPEKAFSVRSSIQRDLTSFSCFLLWLKQMLIQRSMHTESVPIVQIIQDVVLCRKGKV